MGYSARSNIVYGFQITEEEEERYISSDEDISVSSKGEVGLVGSGDGRSGVHSYVLGIVLSSGDYYSPKPISIMGPTEKKLRELKEVAKQYNFAWQKPVPMLITRIM